VRADQSFMFKRAAPFTPADPRRTLRWLPMLTALLFFFSFGTAAGQKAGTDTPPGKASSATSAQPAPGEWQSLFDGKSLGGWQQTPFTGRGQVRIVNGTILLGAGEEMTGITWTKGFPKSNYEVRLEAVRMQGNDFFATMTFPVKDSYCSWVTGGWGGDIVGLSSLDGWDASDNETRSYYQFQNGQWYSLRLRVTDDVIEAWIDNDMVIRVALKGRRIGLRFGEIKLSAPFGFAAYVTTGGLRKLEYRLLPAAAGVKYM